MLEGYGSEDSSDPEDLRRFARFLDSVFLLVKQHTSDYAAIRIWLFSSLVPIP